MSENKRNYSMDAFRLVAALLVVVCHTDFLIEAPDGIYQFIARFAPRISVAFFFSISGYYYIKALTVKEGVFKKQFFSLLKVYAAWSLIYYGASFVVNVVMEKKSVIVFLAERVIFFVTKGSYSHFWYFPALIYSVLFVTLFYKLFGKRGICLLAGISLVLFVAGNLGSSYYVIGMKIPVFREIISIHRDGYEVFRGIFCMGLPYFMTGYFLNKMEGAIFKADEKRLNSMLLVTLILYFAEIYVLSNVLKWNDYPEVFVMLYPTVMVIMMVLLRKPKPEWKKFTGTCRRLSGYIYYVHPLLILILGLAAGVCDVTVPSVVLYLLVIALSIGSGMLLIRLNKKLKWLSWLIP